MKINKNKQIKQIKWSRITCFGRNFYPFFGWFSLRKSLQNHSQNLIFGACGAKIAKKTASFGHGKNDKNHFFTLWNKVPLKKISPRIATANLSDFGGAQIFPTTKRGIQFCHHLGGCHEDQTCDSTEPQFPSYHKYHPSHHPSYHKVS